MVIVSWVVFGLLALLWTGGAWLTAEVTGWLAQLLASGEAVQVASGAASLPVPAWAQLWIDPAWLEMLRSFLAWSLSLAAGSAAAIGTMAAWVVAAIWIGWGLGMALLVLAAVAIHVLIKRSARRPALA